jgi:general stress protein CsbA
VESDLCEYLIITAVTFCIFVQLLMYSLFCASYCLYYTESKIVLATDSMDRTSDVIEGIASLSCMSSES